MKNWILPFLVSVCLYSHSQETLSENSGRTATHFASMEEKTRLIEDTTQVFDVPDSIAQFPGGNTELMRYLIHNFRVPASLSNENITGRIYARFIVERDGSIRHVEVLRGLNPELDAEAKRLILTMPRWQPGKMYNRYTRQFDPVRSYFTVPIKIEI